MVIGIESSAHTFGVGITDGKSILANEKDMFHITTKGMIPGDVANFHTENSGNVIERAIEKAGIRIDELEGVGYTKGPGMGPCLQVGMLAAKTIAKRLNIPIVPVNHAVGHIEITKFFAHLNDPIALYVSGGNSQILKLDKKAHRYRVLGETFDIGVGNMLDNFARSAKLNPAWGSTVAKMAAGGKYVELPYTVKGMDFAFTGLLTKATELLKEKSVPDLCYSLQEFAFSTLCEAAERALLLTNSNELCVCGGVAQSKRLKDMLNDVAKEHRYRFGYAADEYNADNGAMIAYVAEKMLSSGIEEKLENCDIEQKYRIETATVY